MNRLARWVSPGICVLAAVCAVSADTADTAIYGRRMVARCVEQDMASEEYGPSPFKYAATAYRIGKVTVDEEQVHVTVAFRVVYDQGCDGHDYYRPARWIERTYDIDKAVLGTPQMRSQMLGIDLLNRKRAAQIERSTLYYVIAGCFRLEKAAKQHAASESRKLGEYGFAVLRSSDYAGLRPGYFIVAQRYGFPWQTEDLAEARRLVAMYAQRGISSYIKRIPPLTRDPGRSGENRSREGWPRAL